MTGIEQAIAAVKKAKALAEGLGVGEPAVSKWRKRGYAPPDRWDDIARLTGVGVEALALDMARGRGK